MIDTPGSDVNANDPIVQAVVNAYTEAKHAKLNRMIKNSLNYNTYHMRQDYSHKTKGQSKEILPKQAVATEQLTSFIQQALLDISHFFDVEKLPFAKNALLLPEEVQKLLARQLDKNNIAQFIADTVKTGLLGSLMITKIHGKKVACPKFVVDDGFLPNPNRFGSKPSKVLRKETKDYWQLQIDLIRPEDYFPDPLMGNLYEIHRIEMDYYKLLQIAEENPDDYDLEAVKAIPGMGSDEEDHKLKKQRETDQNVNYQNFRKRVVIKEFWGSILDPVTGTLLYEKVVTAVANNRFIIRPPKKNPFWHGESPFVVAPIIRVPHSVWGKALMDGPTLHNIALNELYNLILDGGMASVFGIRQLREQWLANPDQVNDGIPPGTTLILNSSAPAGAKVMERVDTGALPPEALSLYNLVDREFQGSALTTDIRTGVLPQRQVKATEIVASQNAITGMFSGVVKVIEKDFLVKFLKKCELTMFQHMDDLHVDEVKSMLGEERALQLANTPSKEIFAGTVGNYAYNVYGLSDVLNRHNDFQKITALLQTVAGSPEMMQLFQSEYSMQRLLGEIIKSLDINEDRIKLDPEEAKAQARRQQMASQMNQAQQQQNNQRPGGPPQMQTQIPQVGAMSQQQLPRVSGITNPS